ncbi:FAD-dependent monooxygenase [Streptomyces achromogenes]|uniref:FAD-dependent monooxygenase n=1 Tax=Streptomyces achromogenes TaxID=67255 RepID=UPI0033CC4CED
MRADVLVVGAGPVGLMLAGELRLGGAEVVVLERLPRPTTESRASTLHARTMEIFAARGLLEALGTPPNDVMGHFGGVPLDLTLPTPYPGQWKVPQTRTEELLQTWALSLGATVRRGHALRALTVTDTGVEAEATGPDGRPVRVSARYAVGCDGEHSTVRELTGADFPGQDAGRELIRADVAGIDIPDRRFQRLQRGLAIAARRPDGVTRVMVHEFGRAARPRTGAPDFAEVVDVWKRVTGEDIGGGTPLWVNAFGDASRQVARYRDGRVLFAGDAAHVQMPVGGQALNLGLQDAVNLGWKLAAEIRGRAPEGLLDTYHSERHTVGARVLSNIRAQTTFLLGGPDTEALREVFRELIDPAHTRHTRAHLAGMISGLDIRYDVGPGDHPLLGARMPYGELDEAPDSACRAARGVLLDFTGPGSPSGPEPRTVAAGWADRVDVVTAAFRTADGPSALSGARAVLVRPDGHVAWTDSGAGRLETALHRWFGAPVS